MIEMACSRSIDLWQASSDRKMTVLLLLAAQGDDGSRAQDFQLGLSLLARPQSALSAGMPPTQAQTQFCHS